ncbi:hypothetical protein VN0420_06700 [Helicobacter pylori]|nr:hypothetical protein VN0420_06700 [Helicobacter pylori]
MQVSQYLYQNVQSIWEDCISHPFVQGIGRGTLERDKFRFYIIQDYLFLLEYAKVFALGVVKACDEAVMREFSNAIQDILNNEMSIHNHYIRELQITPKEFQACVNWNINLLDSLTLASSKQEIEKLKEIFITTSEYEYLFWDMAYQS